MIICLVQCIRRHQIWGDWCKTSLQYMFKSYYPVLNSSYTWNLVTLRNWKVGWRGGNKRDRRSKLPNLYTTKTLVLVWHFVTFNWAKLESIGQQWLNKGNSNGLTSRIPRSTGPKRMKFGKLWLLQHCHSQEIQWKSWQKVGSRSCSHCFFDHLRSFCFSIKIREYLWSDDPMGFIK